ncbi:MAG: hypothetical protein FJ098_12545, partial [Deltaproteobacteria bacterium]|nr:hypothetical protein [Deltaproteobacteria bacterium]
CVSAGGPGEDTVEPPEDTTGCPPADGGYGDVCACKEQCATQLCVQNFLTGQNTCSMLCVADSSCPGTDICVTIDPSTKICYANDAGVTPPTCNPDQAGCLKGLVLSNLLGQCVCTVPCTGAAADCPQGMACHFDQGSGLKVCVAVGGFCATGNNPCFSAACLGDGATGYCSAICLGAADCPPGWTCQAVQGGNACVKP